MRFLNGCNKVVIELCVEQFWSEIILVRSFDYDFRQNFTPFSSITFIYSRHKIYDVFMLQKFVAYGKMFYSRATFPKNFLLLSLKAVYQCLFSFASIFVLHNAGLG